MSYRIVGDSCLEINENLRNGMKITQVPLTLQVDDNIVLDDETFDQKAFLKMVEESPNCPKSACPSPEAFMKACECEEDDVYVITLSSHLSGAYNSARIGREMYLEEHGEKNILIIDSEAASAGETNIAMVIQEMYNQGMNFAQISEKILKMRDQQRTYFVVDTLEHLRKNGRLSGLKTMVATALNIKPVMGADHGVIVKYDQARGLSKAYGKMCDMAVKNAGDTKKSHVVISHCNCPERAEQVKAELEKRAEFLKITITGMAGVASLYAADGGIILSVEQG